MQAPKLKRRRMQADFRGTEEWSALTTAQRCDTARIHNSTWHVGKAAVSPCTDVIFEELRVGQRLQVQERFWDFNHPESPLNSTKDAEV